jgi:ubiquitin-like domain-containing CTD phosphatase 1
VFDLKAQLQALTRVPPERQKILGFVKGKLPPEQERMYVVCSLTFTHAHVKALEAISNSRTVESSRLWGHAKEMKSRTHPVSSTIYESVDFLYLLSRLDLEFLPDVLNDLDVDFSADPAAALAYKNDQRNKRKIREATEKLELNIITPSREGKKLLVLDIDYSKRRPVVSDAQAFEANKAQRSWTRSR